LFEDADPYGGVDGVCAKAADEAADVGWIGVVGMAAGVFGGVQDLVEQQGEEFQLGGAGGLGGILCLQ
jgi:hypothetical protein